MSDLLMQKLTLAKAKRVFTTKRKCYDAISEIYKLPSIISKCISRNYLKEIMKENCALFRIENKDFHPPYIKKKHVTAKEVLEAIEHLLKKKNLPPTGFDRRGLPDWNWLLGVYFYLDEKDELGLFPDSIRPESEIEVSVDPKILKAIENYEPDLGRTRSILQLSQEEKMNYKKRRLELKLKRRQQNFQDQLEEFETSAQQLVYQLKELENCAEESTVEKKITKKVKYADEATIPLPVDSFFKDYEKQENYTKLEQDEVIFLN